MARPEPRLQTTADVSPYNALHRHRNPVSGLAKTQEQFDQALDLRREELAAHLVVNLRNGPQATLLGTEPYTGKTLADLEAELNLSFEQILIDVIGPEGASGAYFVMDDALQSRLLSDPFVGVLGWQSRRIPSQRPRNPRQDYRRIRRQSGSLELTEAVRKMTSLQRMCSGWLRVASSPEWLQIVILIRQTQRPLPIRSCINWPPALIWGW